MATAGTTGPPGGGNGSKTPWKKPSGPAPKQGKFLFIKEIN